MILFRADAILASDNSKSGKGVTHEMDREVFNSPTQVAISTSLLHNITFVVEFWTRAHFHLKPSLPARKCLWCRELVKMKFRDLKSLSVKPRSRKNSPLHTCD